MTAEAGFLAESGTAAPAARILVVEDERIVARCLRQQLTALGYEVVDGVSSGAEAIQKAEERRPDLVLMDINLEGPMDGVDAAAIIRERFCIPVIYLTAYSNTEILARAKLTEPYGYILKPYEDRNLHVAIETGLYKHQIERKQQQRERRQEMQTRQATKMEAIAQLAGGIAHAFNNLMTVVLGYSEIVLAQLKADESLFANVLEIKRSAARTVALTGKLLAFSRKQNLALHPVNLNALVCGLAPVVKIMQGGVKLELRLELGIALTNANQLQLEESILTLARNACHAMPDGGELTIQTANVELGQAYADDHPDIRPGPYILLAVSDTGVGMDEEALRHVFEPFYTEDTGVGAGLGLAAIYGFVRQCGGDIDVRSQPCQGTTFRIYLPRHLQSISQE